MKKIFGFAVIASAIVSMTALTSCEDMFTAENSLVTTNLNPKDTLYSVMGIVKQMQKLATRTIVLGELRADLVDINSSTTTPLQEVSANMVGEDNPYNSPADYYAVINSCNIYLANVDTAHITHNEVYYEKEILAVKAYRAWTYLELAKIYGEVPFVTEPVLAASQAEDIVANFYYNRKNLTEICDYFINDLVSYLSYNNRAARNLDLRPSYAQNYQNVTMANFFIPARVMLAELYLWRGSATGNRQDFIEAVRHYHDFLTFTGEEHPTGYGYDVVWTNRNFNQTSDNYASRSRFTMRNLTSTDADYVCYIPVDTTEYYGTVSDIREVFCSTYKNNYFAQANPSEYLKQLSKEQRYCKYLYTSDQFQDTLYGPVDEKKVTNATMIGDLRLFAVCNNISVLDKYHDYNTERQYILKYTAGASQLYNDERTNFVPLFRYTMLYLHMAEALNRAGFPETAFAVLKYGLTEDLMNDRSIIPAEEYEGLKAITQWGFSSGETSSFVEWDRDEFIAYDPTDVTETRTPNQMGIHSLGSGDSPQNAYYTLPHDSALWAVYDKAVADSLAVRKEMLNFIALTPLTKESTPEDSAFYNQTIATYKAAIAELNAKAQSEYSLAITEQREAFPAFVAQKILEEEAIEGMFEGYRFYDLMRWAMYTHDSDFIAYQVGNRKGIDKQAPVTSLLSGMWYLPLRSR